MASNSKRSWQLQDFMAHGANVNCLALGQKSGRVLVTGGDDKKVNLWAIGQQNCIMSLSGHLTAVECVKFDHIEEKVCAGSQAGTLKLWDLDAAKLFRTLTGHKSGIKCIDFHPYGNFFGSGSLDTSIKLWDYRKRECIFTYKGHQETVNSIKFSPDGQWVASGGEEGEVKIWDLRAGRVLNELDGHSGAVTDVEFHPQEFLLASSSADRSISFWDLENFHLVSKTEKETALIRCLHFKVDGKCLFGGCAEQLKVYGWEPARVFDTVTIGWGKVQDMASTQDQLIGASFNLTRVLICVVDINKVSCSPTSTSRINQSSPFKHGQTVRKSFNKQRPRPSRPVVEVKPIDEEYDTDDLAFNSFIPNVNDYEAGFKPHRSLNRSPPLENENILKSSLNISRSPPPNPFSEPTSEDDISSSSVSANASTKRTIIFHENLAESSQIPVFIPQYSKLPERVTSPVFLKQSQNIQHQQKINYSSNISQVTSVMNGQSTSKVVREILHRANSCKNEEPLSNGNENSLNRNESSSLPDVVSRNRKISTNTEHLKQRALPKLNVTNENLNAKSTVPYVDNESQESEIIPAMSNTPVDLRLEEFLPTSYRSGESKSQQAHSNLSENEVITSLARNHEMILTILKIRQRNLEIIYSLWHNQDLKCALEGAVSMNDQAVLIDILSAINKRPSLWNLDVCVVLLPAIHNLLHSKYEMYMSVCCESLQLILKNFSTVIKTNVQWSSPTIGVDISKEERYAKCIKCYENLISIRTFLLKRQTMQGKLGQSFRELQSMLYAIEK
ncbi:hypothetical protein PGB90_001448 [Kerria lacca]